jgi:hypothetical protein
VETANLHSKEARSSNHLTCATSGAGLRKICEILRAIFRQNTLPLGIGES